MSGYQPKKRKLTAEINVVPYIDVMLVLLIIFMVTAPFVTQGVDVELPEMTNTKSAQAMAGENPDATFIIVEIDKDGNLGLSVDNKEVRRPLSMQEMITNVKAELSIKPNSPVAVGGDASTPYSEIVLVLDELTRAGVSKVGLLTDLKE